MTDGGNDWRPGKSRRFHFPFVIFYWKAIEAVSIS